MLPKHRSPKIEHEVELGASPLYVPVTDVCTAGMTPFYVSNITCYICCSSSGILYSRTLITHVLVDDVESIARSCKGCMVLVSCRCTHGFKQVADTQLSQIESFFALQRIPTGRLTLS